MIGYVARLPPAMLVLWCYLAWYLAIVGQYFDPSPKLWLSSVGIAGFIGFALNLAAAQRGQRPSPWVVFRLYLFPFCVSSYSALIKGRGFFLLFPTELKPLLTGLAACALVLVLTGLVKASQRRPAATPSDLSDTSDPRAAPH